MQIPPFSLEAQISEIGEEISANQKPSIGCNIKWHPGMEPEWFG